MGNSSSNPKKTTTTNGNQNGKNQNNNGKNKNGAASATTISSSTSSSSTSSSSSQINARPQLNVSNKGLEKNKTRKQILKGYAGNNRGSNRGYPGYFRLSRMEELKRNRNLGIVRPPPYFGLSTMPSTSTTTSSSSSSSMIPTMGFGTGTKIPAIKSGLSLKLPAYSSFEGVSETNEQNNNSNNNQSPFTAPNAFKQLSKRASSSSLGIGAGQSGYGTFGSSSSTTTLSSSNPILRKQLANVSRGATTSGATTSSSTTSGATKNKKRPYNSGISLNVFANNNSTNSNSNTNNNNKNKTAKRRNLGANKNGKYERRSTRKN